MHSSKQALTGLRHAKARRERDAAVPVDFEVFARRKRLEIMKEKITKEKK
jgi:hypothetical protein